MITLIWLLTTIVNCHTKFSRNSSRTGLAVCNKSYKIIRHFSNCKRLSKVVGIKSNLRNSSRIKKSYTETSRANLVVKIIIASSATRFRKTITRRRSQETFYLQKRAISCSSYLNIKVSCFVKLSIYLSILIRSFSYHHLRCGGWLNVKSSHKYSFKTGSVTSVRMRTQHQATERLLFLFFFFPNS